MFTSLRRCAFVFSLSALACLTAAHAQITATGPYHDPVYQFLAQPPEGMTVVYQSETGADIGFESRKDLAAFYVHARPAPVPDLGDFFEMQKETAAKMCSSHIRFTESPSTLDGFPALKLRMDCVSHNLSQLDPAIVVVINMTMREIEGEGKIVYTVGMVTIQTDEHQNESIYGELVDSLHIL